MISMYEILQITHFLNHNLLQKGAFELLGSLSIDDFNGNDM